MAFWAINWFEGFLLSFLFFSYYQTLNQPILLWLFTRMRAAFFLKIGNSFLLNKRFCHQQCSLFILSEFLTLQAVFWFCLPRYPNSSLSSSATLKFCQSIGSSVLNNNSSKKEEGIPNCTACQKLNFFTFFIVTFLTFLLALQNERLNIHFKAHFLGFGDCFNTILEKLWLQIKFQRRLLLHLRSFEVNFSKQLKSNFRLTLSKIHI